MGDVTLKWLVFVALVAICQGAVLPVNDGQIASARQWSRFTRVVDGSIPQALRLDFSRYHHYDELTAYLRAVNAAYPQLTSLYSVGQSVQGIKSLFFYWFT